MLDDGWFHDRRDDTAGLGDWVVDPAVWPDGLDPLIEHVTGLGMEFGLWFEPEMVNPDSDLFREHPDWILSAGGRVPLEHRNQQVLDLTRPEVLDHLFERVDAVLSAHDIRYVKWDHNRDLLEAGSGARGGAPAVHEQTLAFYSLLDRLRAAHPSVAWESCASGGGRIDLGVLERVQRVWASDMTDALARQQIQRWTTQLVAPEYVGAHVSAPTSHTTGRTAVAGLPLRDGAVRRVRDRVGPDDGFSRRSWTCWRRGWSASRSTGRCCTPAAWCGRSPATRRCCCTGSSVRSEALVAHVQLDESAHNRGVSVRVPGLVADASYALSWEGPVAEKETSMSVRPPAGGPTSGEPMTGAALARQGFWMPRLRPETVTLVRIAPVGRGGVGQPKARHETP